MPDERAVREACRLLEGQTGVTVIGELTWFEVLRAWALPVRLHYESPASSDVPPATDWYIVIDERFPFGKIELFPARAGGLLGTRPHQDRNTPGDAALPWTEGDICVKTPTFNHRRHGDDPDPLGEPHRLLWYTERARSWLVDASAGTLVRKGERFELPQFSPLADTVGFCEDSATFERWEVSTARHGRVELAPLPGGAALVARRFLDSAGGVIVAPAWGACIAECSTPQATGWIRLDAVPIQGSYEAPGTWAELWQCIAKSGVNPESLLRPALAPLRDGMTHTLLVGFPIPLLVGEAPAFMHWQPLQLPARVTSPKPASGFRGNEQGLWSRDQTMTLQGKTPLTWLNGQNWNPEVLGARGRLSAELRGMSVTVLGAGALGSAAAELLVRGGVWDIHVVDPERLTAGNLVRHSLSMEEIGQRKAERLAQRLNRVSPFARVQFSNRHAHDERTAAAAGPRLVLDFTGSDDVLQRLSAGAPESGSLLLSFSMGLGAKRLYIVRAPTLSFQFSEFRAEMQQWLARDLEENAGRQLPHGGPGCWHPLFPARQDEVLMHAAAVVAELERALRGSSRSWSLRVLERGIDEDGTLTYGPSDAR
ncbi:MAG: ThiF family adenylyltransferase [Phycisphaeraceae bacterium]|nr:ThiF family adenylyltransferase [Phycisphaeraceae bacterium]